MEDDTWSFAFSTSSRSYQSALKSLSDLCIDFEEIEGDDDDLRAEYPCPFCAEDFDLVDLCCHIDDEHPLEPKAEVCPVCASRVGRNMVGHITTHHGDIYRISFSGRNMVGHIKTHHGDIYKSLQKLKRQKDESYSTLPFFKEELEDGYLQSLLSGSSSTVSSSRMAPDPLISFLYTHHTDEPESVQSASSIELTVEEKSSEDKVLERDVQLPLLSDKEHMEKTKRSDFVQGLLLSTILDDDL